MVACVVCLVEHPPHINCRPVDLLAASGRPSAPKPQKLKPAVPVILPVASSLLRPMTDADLGVGLKLKLTRREYLALKARERRARQSAAKKLKQLHPDTLERFESKCFPDPNSGCWIWGGQLGQKHKNSGPYGMFQISQRDYAAHRVSWELYRGEIPDGMYVCHKCDVPYCVNPEHLFLGTALDNTRDMIQKGRNACVVGVMNPVSKLTEAQVLEIRARLKKHGDAKRLAKEFGVSSAQITAIKQRRYWAHLPPSGQETERLD